jgi:hypothetical protein
MKAKNPRRKFWYSYYERKQAEKEILREILLANPNF